MEKTQLVELEIKVQSLMEKIESVKQENQSLRQRIAAIPRSIHFTRASPCAGEN